MPQGDRTGPNGFGPMTGRGAGYCAAYGAPGHMNLYTGRGRGFNRAGGGRGRGFRNMSAAAPMGAPYSDPYYAPVPPSMTASEEATMLKQQAKYMQENLNALQERIQELENSETADK